MNADCLLKNNMLLCKMYLTEVWVSFTRVTWSTCSCIYFCCRFYILWYLILMPCFFKYKLWFLAAVILSKMAIIFGDVTVNKGALQLLKSNQEIKYNYLPFFVSWLTKLLCCLSLISVNIRLANYKEYNYLSRCVILEAEYLYRQATWPMLLKWKKHIIRSKRWLIFFRLCGNTW